MSTTIILILVLIVFLGGVGIVVLSVIKASRVQIAPTRARYKSKPSGSGVAALNPLRDPSPTGDSLDCFPSKNPTDGRDLIFDKNCESAKLGAYGLPTAGSVSDIARIMGVSEGEIRWLMSNNGDHYSRVEMRGRNGKRRLLFPPKTKMKACQRWILRNILDKVPTHQAAEGFRKKHSVLTHATKHANKHVVYAMDISRFFDTIKSKRVYGVFRRIGYSEEAALAFALLTTNGGRLPQGAPTSPALANLVCNRMDARLTGLANKYGATYSRYADDMAFSGGPEFAAKWPSFRFVVRKIIKETGFQLNPAKMRIMKSTSRQHVTGLVVNKGPKIKRSEYRKLKAIIHNASKTGLEAQNKYKHKSFREYLKGRISFVHMVQPEKAAKLKAALEKVA